MSKKLSHEDYTVGWICPLEVEQIAAMEMLDEDHEPLPQPPTDHNVYNLGSIAGHNVVIAGLYQTGNSHAATVVTQMRMTFPNLRFGMLVGIGGGVPAKTDNGMIRLGDIVVSKPAGEHSGAIQYDHGKAKVGHFERTGALERPPAVLLNAAQDLAVKRARSREDPVDDNIKRIDTSIRGLRRYKYPGGAQDHLYKPGYIHRELGVACDDCGCDPSQRIQRLPNDEDEEPYIVVHRGTIASGELVVKDAELRDKLAKQYGLLCFEMEAAGALADFPCIVVRGISDYCDSHKNDQWHGYAAAAAAAYARQLFFHMPIDEVQRYISEIAEKAIQSVKDRQDDQYRQEILDWLTPVNYGSQQSDFIIRRQSGTGRWLIESTKFQRWLETKNQTLFCSGIPGAGKTILTSVVVEELITRFQYDKSIGIAYLYCNFLRQDKQTAEDLLASLLKQLSQGWPSLPPSVKSLYDKHKDRQTQLLFGEISKALQSVAAIYSRVFIIVDALDECEDYYECRTRFLSAIFDLQTITGANLLATSRDVPEIVAKFKGSISVEIRATDDDVRRYVDGRKLRLPKFGGRMPEEQEELQKKLQEEIKTEIVKAVDGMFLLAQLHLDSLIGKPSPKAVRAALARLPVGSEAYDHAYRDAIKRIEGQVSDQEGLAKRVLSWITCAKRQLTASELQHALAVETNESELDEDNLPQIEDIVSVCAGLVTVDEESNIIRLVHYTAQEYFGRKQAHWFPNAESDITTICITYLSFDVFGSGFCQTDNEFEARLKSNQLYEYATHNWGHHARKATVEVDHLILGFLENEFKVSASSQAIMASTSYPSNSQKVPRHVTGAHLAAYFGLVKSMITLLESGHHPDLKDSYGQTPLSWASQNGREGVVKVLLANENVKPDSKDNNGRTPLWWAAAVGHEAVVQLLLAKDGVNPDSVDKYGQTPLSSACNGHDAVVKLLLDRDDVDPESRDIHSQTPLWWAARNGHEKVVRLLLKKGRVGPDPKDDEYRRSPLWRAAENGHDVVVKILLANDGVNPDSKDKFGQTPLWVAAENGHEAVVGQLLANDRVDPDSKDTEYGQTPLSLAAENGHEAVVRLLLAKDGVNPISKDYDGQTPLDWATKNCHQSIIRILTTQSPVRHANQLGDFTVKLADADGQSIDKLGDLENIASDDDSVESSMDSTVSTTSDVSSFRLGVLNNFIELFLRHSELEPLYAAAISKVGPQIFQRKYGRLLQRYGRRLQQEASNTLERDAAYFIRHSAREIASKLKLAMSETARAREAVQVSLNEGPSYQTIINWLEPREDLRNNPIISDETGEELSDASNSNESEPDDNAPLGTPSVVRNFIIAGPAFIDLCKSFRAWLDIDEDQKRGPVDDQKILAREKSN